MTVSLESIRAAINASTYHPLGLTADILWLRNKDAYMIDVRIIHKFMSEEIKGSTVYKWEDASHEAIANEIEEIVTKMNNKIADELERIARGLRH